MGGRRPVPTLRFGQAPRFVRVTTPAVARQVERMMVAVVSSFDGTGYEAALPGVQVAGKTGTAELRTTVNPKNPSAASSPSNTDAWFVGYAPVGAPRIVVGALFPGQGAGGTTAAPAAIPTRRQAISLGAAAPVLLCLSVAARLAWTYLVPNGANFVDLHVYIGAAATLNHPGALYSYVYADQTPDFPLPFTYPPFAAVVFYPLHFLPFGLGQLVEKYTGKQPFDAEFVAARRATVRQQVSDMFIR